MPYESPSPIERQDVFGENRWPFENVPENAQRAADAAAERIRASGWSEDRVGKIRRAVEEAFAFAGRMSAAGKEIWLAVDIAEGQEGKATVTLKYDEEQGGRVPTEVEVFQMAADADTGVAFPPGEIILPFRKED